MRLRSMNTKELYKRYTKEIDKCKYNELKLGITSECKQKINDCYDRIVGRQTELELDLNERKAILLDENDHKKGYAFNTKTLVIGSFLGAGVGVYIDDLYGLIKNFIKFFKEMSFDQSPMEILNNPFIYKSSVIIIVLFCIIYFYNKRDSFKNENIQFTFQIDMNEYEIEKINEMLKEL